MFVKVLLLLMCWDAAHSSVSVGLFNFPHTWIYTEVYKVISSLFLYEVWIWTCINLRLSVQSLLFIWILQEFLF